MPRTMFERLLELTLIKKFRRKLKLKNVKQFAQDYVPSR